ncbi:MAG: DNA primase [Alicyclobacillus sp.]|nr:DNA primase [Alicyclobacillus sp.]
MWRIPQDFVETVQRSVDIVEVVGEYVPLRRSGRGYVGLCPFHNERTPSFTVSQDRGLYHCFGCGAGGTVIRFVMDIEGLTFAEAVVRLAERVHLPLPETLRGREAAANADDRLVRMRNAHELAAKFYGYILMNASAGVQALTYLEDRGLRRETIAEFRLGYAPPAERRLVEFLGKRGYAPDLLVDCGLAVAVGSRVVDRFRNRVMIPICDHRGQVVGFGGRALDVDAKVKYLNSPESALFHKGRLLFNLNRARRGIRQSGHAVLLEGYMDVLSAWQAGVTNAVASMGTALTEEHMAALKRYTDRIVVAYDGDAAGQKATRRVVDLTRQGAVDCRVAVFPDGMDPDDFIRRKGAEAFRRHLESQTVTAVQFLIQSLRAEAQLESSAGRTAYLRSVLRLLAERATPIERDTEVRRLAEEFHVAPEALHQEYRLLAQGVEKRALRARAQVTGPRAPVPPVVAAEVRAGEYILRSLLQDGTCAPWLEEMGVMALATPEQTALLALLYEFRLQYPEASAGSFIDRLEDEALRAYASSLAMRDDAPVADRAMVLDCIRTLRLRELEGRYREVLTALVEAQVEGRADQVNQQRQLAALLQQQIRAVQASRSQTDAGRIKEAGIE